MIGASNLAIIIFTILLGNLDLGMTNQLLLVVSFVPLFYLHSLLIGRFGKKSVHEEAYKASFALGSKKIQLASYPYHREEKNLSNQSHSVGINQQETKLTELQEKRIQEFDSFKEKHDKIRSIKKYKSDLDSA